MTTKSIRTLASFFSNGVNSINDRDQSVIHISSITGCQKRLWKTLEKNKPSFNGEEYTNYTMPSLFGQAMHGLFEFLIKDCLAGHVETEVGVSFQPNYPVIGAADIVDEDSAIDLKFLSSWNFSNQKMNPSVAYRMQVLLYAYGLDKEYGVLFLVDRGVLNYTTASFKVSEHEADIDFFLNRPKEIYDMEECPEREHESPDNFECRYCPFLMECHYRKKH